MTTSRQMIAEWFDAGVQKGATHMIVVCDTFDYEDYPVYVAPNEVAKTKAGNYDNKNMQRIMEVYNLAMDKAEQLAQRRAFNY